MKELQELFYPNGAKIYPKGSILKLDDLGFALWYADDGTTVLVQISNKNGGARSRRVQICTDNFTPEEHLLIKEELDSLGYTVKCIDRKRNGQLRAQINGNSQHFICMLESSFLNFPSLLYKLDLGYRLESLNKKHYVSDEYRECFLRISAHPQFFDRVKEKLSELEDDIVRTSNEDN